MVTKVFWLWLPLGFMAFQIIIEVSLSHDTLAMLHSENGPHETLQFIILVMALFIALSALRFIDWTQEKWLAGWLALAAICCFYVAGEEVSWGQHLFDWTTPAFWQTVNDQQETNLHNISSWLDQKPRFALELGIIVGGLVIPLIRKLKPLMLPEKFVLLYPPAILSVIALLATLPEIADKIAGYFDLVLFERVSEVQELYMFYFVLIYLLFILKALRHRNI